MSPGTVMRVQLAALLLAFLVAAIVLAIRYVLGFSFGYSIWWTYSLAAVMAVLVYSGVTMSHEILQIREFLKQVAVWLAISTLLPLVVWYGTSVFHAPPDEYKYRNALNDIQEREVEAEKDVARKKQLLQERHALEEAHEAARAAFHRTVFWVAYPVGLAALVVGSLLTVQSVGSALMFGGLSALTAGCYSYWDKMDSSLRFGSLLLALAVVLAIGIWRYRPPPDRAFLSVRPA
jgi:hypothetical protein